MKKDAMGKDEMKK